MGDRITENAIEEFAIGLLEKSGYQYVYAPDIAPDSDTPARQSYADVLLLDFLRTAVGRINPQIPAEAREDAIKQIQRLNSPELVVNNEEFHRMLTAGIKVIYQKDLPARLGQAGGTEERGDLVWLIDFKNPENNDFMVANQFTVKNSSPLGDGGPSNPPLGGWGHKRLDVILFINGLPLVVMELKNPVDENATVKSAFNQLQTYKQAIPGLFTYNAFMLVSDGLEAKAGSLSADLSRFMVWKLLNDKTETSYEWGHSPKRGVFSSLIVGQLETLINGMLNKETLLDIICHFIVFEKSAKLTPPHNLSNGVTTVHTIKKLAAYHQYYAVN